ncbi:hypothetical protein Tco_0054633 [Tanacetum coccineum]
MADANLIRTLGDYSKPSHEGYMNTIELPEGNNLVPLRSDTIRLVQNRCSFHRLWSEDPNILSSKYPHWTDAMNQEMDALLRNGTWEIIDLPKGRKAIGSK